MARKSLQFYCTICIKIPTLSLADIVLLFASADSENVYEFFITRLDLY